MRICSSRRCCPASRNGRCQVTRWRSTGDDRWPTLQWPREVPLSGEPADVHDRIAAYSAWLKTASLPKLFIDAEPGVFITGRIRRLASSLPKQHRVVVGGLHFVQEDSPDEVGRAIAGWLEQDVRAVSSKSGL